MLAGNLPSSAARILFIDVVGKGDSRPQEDLPGLPEKVLLTRQLNTLPMQHKQSWGV